MKVIGKFQGKILNWFVRLHLVTIFSQNMFYSWHVIDLSGMQLKCKMESMVKIEKNAFYLR